MLPFFALAVGAIVASQVQAAAPSAQAGALTFQVATIRPSTEAEDWTMQIRGTHFFTRHTTVDDLITYAYDVHVSQIVDAPGWFSTARFDVEGVPDLPDRPTREQFHAMVQALLATRFGLVLHTAKQPLAAYTLTLVPGPPKLPKAVVVPGHHPGYGFDRGALTVKDMTVAGFAMLLQRLVLDRPVVDQTHLTNHFDFDLHWTPDESQFTQMQGSGVDARVPANTPDTPNLYTAMSEQLGLKLRNGRVPVDVLAIDHATQPTPN